ncbi:HAMP domain-containing histidine kinase [Sulfurimonas sp. SAG-AH-194-C21]|nr:HAMP domain-containing sensor histidine kinase [Sulfurimonas sp. SAG-AH-194-C21]MDF1883312.1 HAMP domain-containing histidine kinase [Sulfurimonas sp. SAG-AH-194-C21]
MILVFESLNRILSIADTTLNTEEEKRQHGFLIYMGLLMSLGGLMWGTFCLFFDLYVAASIPFSYVLITILNFSFLRQTKNFFIAQKTQILISLILPFFFQYFLGGFVSSGGNVLWSVIAVFGSFTLRDKKASIIWLLLFIAVIITSGIVDSNAKVHDLALSESYVVLFFVVNFIMIISIVFSLYYYFVSSEEDARNRLNESLEELKKAKNQLVESEKMASLGSLVSGVAHEINTPLGVGLTGISQISHEIKKMEANYHSESLTEEALLGSINSIYKLSQTIHERLNNAATLVKSFKDISADQHFEDKREFMLKDYIGNLIMSLQNPIKSKQVSIINNIDEDILLDSYPGIFSQILTNLILNSITHAFEDNTQNTIEISSKKDDVFLLEYRDNGIGITQEVQRKIFDPFFTTKRGQGGSGLGMNIVYNLVTQKLKGTMNIVNVSPHGLGFDIILDKSHIKA